jgi:outer membrane protein OmpA-like peptidoglycan-associated protein
MLDEQDQGTRIGVGVALGVALLLTIGLSLWLAMRGARPDAAPTRAATAAGTAAPGAAAAAAAAATVAVTEATTFVDANLSGPIIATLYFPVSDSALPADAGAAIAAIKKAADDSPGKKLLLSGFHDRTGNAEKNAELAKNRARAVRTALRSEGVAAERIVMRKPESTTGDGSNREARRVEVRLAD